MDFQAQVRAAGFPEDVQFTVRPDGGDRVFRAVGHGTGAELRLTAEAVRMYGEGPATAAALTQLCKAVEAGLPPLGADGVAAHLTFLGD